MNLRRTHSLHAVVTFLRGRLRARYAAQEAAFLARRFSSRRAAAAAAAGSAAAAAGSMLCCDASQRNMEPVAARRQRRSETPLRLDLYYAGTECFWITNTAGAYDRVPDICYHADVDALIRTCAQFTVSHVTLSMIDFDDADVLGRLMRFCAPTLVSLTLRFVTLGGRSGAAAAAAAAAVAAAVAAPDYPRLKVLSLDENGFDDECMGVLAERLGEGAFRCVQSMRLIDDTQPRGPTVRGVDSVMWALAKAGMHELQDVSVVVRSVARQPRAAVWKFITTRRVETRLHFWGPCINDTFGMYQDALRERNAETVGLRRDDRQARDAVYEMLCIVKLRRDEPVARLLGIYTHHEFLRRVLRMLVDGVWAE